MNFLGEAHRKQHQGSWLKACEWRLQCGCQESSLDLWLHRWMSITFTMTLGLIAPSILGQYWVTCLTRIIDTPEGSQKRGFIHSFIHQIFIEYLQSAGTFLGTGDLATNTSDKALAPTNLRCSGEGWSVKPCTNEYLDIEISLKENKMGWCAGKWLNKQKRGVNFYRVVQESVPEELTSKGWVRTWYRKIQEKNFTVKGVANTGAEVGKSLERRTRDSRSGKQWTTMKVVWSEVRKAGGVGMLNNCVHSTYYGPGNTLSASQRVTHLSSWKRWWFRIKLNHS